MKDATHIKKVAKYGTFGWTEKPPMHARAGDLYARLQVHMTCRYFTGIYLNYDPYFPTFLLIRFVG